MKAHLRIAFPMDDLEKMIKFYCDGLDFEILSSFEEHGGFNGIMLGHKNMSYHLEFTTNKNGIIDKRKSAEHLLVFYIPDKSEWQKYIDRLDTIGYASVKSVNPYWDIQGKTFSDPDGNRIVLQNDDWKG